MALCFHTAASTSCAAAESCSPLVKGNRLQVEFQQLVRKQSHTGTSGHNAHLLRAARFDRASTNASYVTIRVGPNEKKND